MLPVNGSVTGRAHEPFLCKHLCDVSLPGVLLSISWFAHAPAVAPGERTCPLSFLCPADDFVDGRIRLFTFNIILIHLAVSPPPCPFSFSLPASNSFPPPPFY